MAFKRWNRRFEGPFFVPDFLKHEAGVYVIWCKNKDTLTVLDVGEAEDIREHVGTHKHIEYWHPYCKGKVYYSATYTEGGQREERLKIERMIRSTSYISGDSVQERVIQFEPFTNLKNEKKQDESMAEPPNIPDRKSPTLSDTEKILLVKQHISDYLAKCEDWNINDFQWSQSNEDVVAGIHRLWVFSGQKILSITYSNEELIEDCDTDQWQNRLAQKIKDVS